MQEDIRKAIQAYAVFDAQTNRYVTKPAYATKPTVDLQPNWQDNLKRNIQKILVAHLTAKGVSEEAINRQFKSMALFCHPDKAAKHPEIKWVNDLYSVDSARSTVYEWLNTMKDELQKKPEAAINNLNGLYEYFKDQKNKCEDSFIAGFYDDCMHLLDAILKYQQYAESMTDKAAYQLILKSIPTYLAFCLFSMAATEVASFYVLTFSLYKIGGMIESCGQALNAPTIQSVGEKLHESAALLLVGGSTLTVRLMDLCFWSSNQVLTLGYGVGQTLFKPQITAPQYTQTQWLEKFESDSMKKLVFQLVLYIVQPQWLSTYRTFRQKSVVIGGTLVRLADMDKTLTGNDKYIAAEQLLQRTVSENKALFPTDSDAYRAVTLSIDFARALRGEYDCEKTPLLLDV